MPKPTSGATIPLYNAAGAHDAGSGRQECGGGVLPAARAAASSLPSARIAAVSACDRIICAREAKTGMRPASAEMVWRPTTFGTVLPHVELISPDGNVLAFRQVAPENRPPPKKSAAVAGEQMLHDASASRSGNPPPSSDAEQPDLRLVGVCIFSNTVGEEHRLNYCP